jgi:uncharacterized membrane protein YphA (DoxX/SURF4 family)
MQRSTAFFLVLLRLAIGCHFLYEGLHKLHSMAVGPSETNRPFSSAGYFREAQGPLGSVMLSQFGDPDEEALARLIPLPMTGDKDPAKDKAHQRIPVALAEDWDSWFKLFCTVQGLDEHQKKRAEATLEQAKNQVVLWLETSQEELSKPYLPSTVKIKQPLPKRVKDYQKQLADIREMLKGKLWLFGKDVEKQHLIQAKAEAAQMRTALVKDLQKKTAQMKDLVAGVLTRKERVDLGRVLARIQALEALQKAATEEKRAEQEKEFDKLIGPVEEILSVRDANQVGGVLMQHNPLVVATLLSDFLTDPKAPPIPQETFDKLIVSLNTRPVDEKKILLGTLVPEQRRELQTDLMTYSSFKPRDVWWARAEVYRALEQVEAGDVPARPASRSLYWLDTLTAWGLTIMGGCLLLGLLTRLNCVLLAGFLLMTYLAVPAFPWLPSPPNSEGNYTFVNKNVIEMLALLALATTQSGRWLGLDAWLHPLFASFRRKGRQPSP